MKNHSQTPIRTRFAPSPTGALHVGGIRTALFAYLLARQAGGQFVLRLEDTDKVREVEGSAEHVIASLDALGIHNDEGPINGGPYAPYRQSERLELYMSWAQKLVDSGRAYADPYTPAEVQALRDESRAAKKPFLYRNYRPLDPPAWDGAQPLRFKSEPKNYSFHDEVMGDISTGTEVIDDFIIIKTDGYPTYNFAHIVDDVEMHITHVIRGQEFISSMPNYLNLYEALDIELPIFAHMPHIMNEQGNKKLGKRDGAKDVLDYIRDGYLPETLVSFIATMGWNDGTEQEIFTMDELIEKFSLAKVQRSGARFDEKRLLWMNGHFIRELTIDELAKRTEQFWPDSAREVDQAYRMQILTLAQARLKTLLDLPQLTNFFFAEPSVNLSLISDNKQLKKLDLSEVSHLLGSARDALSSLGNWSAEPIQQSLNQLLETTGQKPGILFSLVRIATTWAPFSPELDATLELLGKERTLARIDHAIKSL